MENATRAPIVLALFLHLYHVIADAEASKLKTIEEIRASLLEIGPDFRHIFLKDNIRGGFISSMKALGKGDSLAQKKWIELKTLIIDCPELRPGPMTRANIAKTSETVTTLDVILTVPCGDSSVNTAAEGEKKKKTGNQKKREKFRKKMTKNKKQQQDMPLNAEYLGLSKTAPTGKRQRTVLDTPVQLPPGQSTEEVFFLRPTPLTSGSSAVSLTLDRGSVSVVYTNDLDPGHVLGSMSGVVSGTLRPDHPSVPLDCGGHLLFGTSNQGILALATFAADGSANAEVNGEANVVTNRHVIAGDKVVIMLPNVVSDAVSDSGPSLLHAVANRSLYKRIDENDDLMEFPSVTEIDLSHSTHRSFGSPFKTASFGLCVRIKNNGNSATAIFVNGSTFYIPRLQAFIAPADAYLKCCEGADISAAVLCAKVCSPAQALDISEASELPEALTGLRNICSLFTSKKKREYDVPFILREIPDPGVVVVRRSDISESDGVFAKVDVSSGAHLTCYSGTVLHQNEWSKIPFVLKEYGAGVPEHRPFVINARVNFSEGLGRFLNQPLRGSANCVLEWVKVPNRPGDIYPSGYISVKATKNIKKDEEIFLKYGAGHVWNTAKKVREPSAEPDKCPADIVYEEDTEDNLEFSL